MSMQQNSSMNAPSPSNPTVTVEWLNEILSNHENCKELMENNEVKLVESKDLAENRGLTNAIMKRIEITYKKEEENNKTLLPKTLVLKISGNDEQTRRHITQTKMFREALFYSSEFAKCESTKNIIPVIYYASGNEEKGEFVILMEDLKKEGFVGVNYVCGNQIWGMPTFDFELPDKVKTLESLYKQLAKFHAKNFNNHSLLSEEWLKGVNLLKGNDKERYETGLKRGFDSWERTKLKIKEQKTEVKYSTKLIEIIDKSFEISTWENLQNHLQNETLKKGFTLIHGDFHGSNMFVDCNTLKVILYDWSEVGVWEPTGDLSQMLISDIPPQVFKENSRKLMEIYHETLLKESNGRLTEENYPFSYCWETFCKGGVEKWIWMFSVISDLPNFPEKGTQYFHDQLLEFIESHGDYQSYLIKSVQ
ncbi:hypothetical protein ABK040_011122 [Willaertia magna]